MTGSRSEAPLGSGSGSAVVDGVDVDAVAAAVRACPGVDALYSTAAAAVASYLPGRQVAGIRVTAEAVTVQVRTTWAVPFATVAARIQLAVAALAAGRRVDVVVADISDPPVGPNDPSLWTTTTALPGARSSGPVTPTAAAIPPPS